ncbi:MAG: chromate resistance protein ChrB domain-containing protein [Candidatus Binatia bacterium]
MASASPIPWLVLIHQLPPKPSYLRVKIWRRLQDLGAIALKNSVYVLPNTNTAREDFEWVLQEIDKDGGEASLCEARLIDGLTDEDLRALFSRAREADYRALSAEIRQLAHATFTSRSRNLSEESRARAIAALARLRKRVAQIAEIDFFSAQGRPTVDGLIFGLEQRLAPARPSTARAPSSALAIGDVTQRTWVTRKGIHIDRIGSAWLVEKFIDPQARFKFVPARGYTPAVRELRFDMFDAEFTHDGDLCTFEVLLRAFDLNDAALQAVAEVVHDIDLKEAKFDREETTGFDHLIVGMAWRCADDDARLEHGTILFDALYTYFQRRKSGAKG